MGFNSFTVNETCENDRTSCWKQWLKEHYNLSDYILTHSSYIGRTESINWTSRGFIEQVYSVRYAPATDTPVAHLEFSFKYDDLNLDFLKAVFENIPVEDLVAYIEASPSGRYTRRIGYLYEFLTGKQLSITKPMMGNYVDLLEPEKYITGNTIKNTRWHINDNLLGTQFFCPMVRKTRTLVELLKRNIPDQIEQLKQSVSEITFHRAVNYLYWKETRSSYEIEREKPSPDRMEKFIHLLTAAGTGPIKQLLDEQRLVQLQNTIVDSRFAAQAFRDFQNYIGQSLPGGQQLVHYICPPPSFVSSLMAGIQETATKTAGIYPEIRATIIAFGFVFIHPFEDGNGRLHRFLIHDILVHDGAVPQELIIPVSAHMINNLRDYDTILERYSKPLMQRIRYNMSDLGEVRVTNDEEVAGYFRYPDLTEHCIYLTQTIHATLEQDMPGELQFIQRYDEVKRALQNIVDMPDRELNLMINF